MVSDAHELMEISVRTRNQLNLITFRNLIVKLYEMGYCARHSPDRSKIEYFQFPLRFTEWENGKETTSFLEIIFGWLAASGFYKAPRKIRTTFSIFHIYIYNSISAGWHTRTQWWQERWVTTYKALSSLGCTLLQFSKYSTQFKQINKAARAMHLDWWMKATHSEYLITIITLKNEIVHEIFCLSPI